MSLRVGRHGGRDAGRHMCVRVCVCGRCVRGDGRRRTELRTGLRGALCALYYIFTVVLHRTSTAAWHALSLTPNQPLALLTYFPFSSPIHISVNYHPIPFYQSIDSHTTPECYLTITTYDPKYAIPPLVLS